MLIEYDTYMLYPRSGCTVRVPVNVPSEEAFHVPNFIAMALPIPPMVSPVDSVKFDGINPKATKPFEKKSATSDM